ncbi:MAG: His/Gly/Thr/Pro-type tRNA ligase C-terminal domain-containing protein [Patescibacteria group bacterium]
MKKNHENKFIAYENLDKIGEIPIYYGFFPHKSPEIKRADLDHAKLLLDGDFIEDEENGRARLPLHVEEKIALLRMYAEDDMHALPQPVMFYFKEPFRGSIKKSSHAYHRYCDLEIMGGTKSIAEALLIQTARAILKEEGYENICVEINSIGDRESINRFARDLSNYYRKHINDMHAECRQLLKKDPFDLLSCTNDKCRKINDDAPRSMDFLSESSRTHFQEVLEYLEALGVPYRINNHLIGNRKYCTETIFAITDADHDKKSSNPKTLAIGVRYDGLAKKMGLKKEIQGVGISLLIKNSKTELRKEIKKFKKPFASFVQLGFESKLLSLSIIEELRHARIPLYLSLARDRLGAQVSVVEKHHIPYALIMGKKEAVERTVIVRNNDTHAQEIISIDKLSGYMKKLEK